jgi:hypothetical protein
VDVRSAVESYIQCGYSSAFMRRSTTSSHRTFAEKTTAELALAAEAGGPFLSFCPSRASLISEFLSNLSLCFPAVPSNQKKTDVLFMTKRESAT